MQLCRNKLWTSLGLFLLLAGLTRASLEPKKFIEPVHPDKIAQFDFTQNLYNFFDLKKPETPAEITIFKTSLAHKYEREFPRYNAKNFNKKSLAATKAPAVQKHIENGFKILYTQKAREQYKPTGDIDYVRNFNADTLATPEERQEIEKIISLTKNELLEEKKETPVITLSPEQQKEVQKNLDLLGQSLFALNQQLPAAPLVHTHIETAEETKARKAAELKLMSDLLARRRTRVEEEEED